MSEPETRQQREHILHTAIASLRQQVADLQALLLKIKPVLESHGHYSLADQIKGPPCDR